MLSLESPRWSELQHAYGAASDIPPLLRQLSALPASQNNKEPWNTIWSALAHQGDVYSASFAAVPHVVHALASAAERADASYFQFPAWVEICWLKSRMEVPADLSASYFDALLQLPELVGRVAHRKWDAGFLVCALSAIAAAKGEPAIAEAVLELTPEVAEDFMKWFYER
jgi:hypothetical protein